MCDQRFSEWIGIYVVAPLIILVGLYYLFRCMICGVKNAEPMTKKRDRHDESLWYMGGFWDGQNYNDCDDGDN